MKEFHIEFYKKGSHVSTWVKAVSAAQALYKYTQAVPGDKWLWNWFKKGDNRLMITQEVPADAPVQLALF